MRSKILAFLLPLLAASAALADPCGMVPPISVQDPVGIARVGDQRTYVFYKDGVETFAIRPGFTGKVDQFGMLIPFPTPPALRKVPDDIFAHVAAAIDPPEVVVNLSFLNFNGNFAFGKAGAARLADKFDLAFRRKDEVKVLREEAVGMYEVAVLEAGSAAALRRWMTDHKYRYPDGMDEVCDEYVELGWCFVAVKTRVGQKAGADPKPGMRKPETTLPAGSTFDGHVQAMGFRFHTDELVVPMRLSAFNEGELRNIVYLLSDGPKRIRSIPEEYVVRQISGAELYRNVTSLLPLRIIGGTAADIPQGWRQALPAQRDPKPRNGLARELFAADLLAIRRGRLSHPHEESEKVLLRIGERLQLRGPAIDKVNLAALAAEREQAIQQALADLKEMTLTVIDGDFPREVLGAQNLKFAEYRMPARRNKAEYYDAKTKQPAPKQPGVVKLGRLDPLPARRSSRLRGALGWSGAGLGLLAVGLLIGRRRRDAALLLLAGTLAVLSLYTSPAAAQEKASEKEILALIDQLDDATKADDAVKKLVAEGEAAVPHLLGEAIEGEKITTRGWCIVCLSEIGGDDVMKRLNELQADGQQPALVRTWAAAAVVYQTKTTDELLKLAPLINNYPALGRPIGMRLVAALGDPEKPASAEDVLNVSVQVPNLQQSLAPAILAFGPEKLIDVMVRSKNQQAANRAAAYLGTLASQGDESVAPAVVAAYKFDPEAKSVPWKSGALWLPGLSWNRENARALVDNLIRWYLWCELNNQKPQQQQIHNNIRGVGLAQAAGYQSPGFQNVPLDQWLLTWGKAVGKEAMQKLLAQQGVDKEPRYQKILNQL